MNQDRGVRLSAFDPNSYHLEISEQQTHRRRRDGGGVGDATRSQKCIFIPSSPADFCLVSDSLKSDSALESLGRVSMVCFGLTS